MNGNRKRQRSKSVTEDRDMARTLRKVTLNDEQDVNKNEASEQERASQTACLGTCSTGVCRSLRAYGRCSTVLAGIERANGIVTYQLLAIQRAHIRESIRSGDQLLYGIPC